MQEDMKLIYETKRLLLLKYPRFGSDLAQAKIEYKTDLKYHTAATDGTNVYFDPEYLKSLNEDDRIFLLAHELMHIKFMHAHRLEDKNGQKRDHDVWNEVTDAIINANLERDGFIIKKGYITDPEALYYTAEELYQKKLKEKQAKQKDGQSSESGQNGNQHQKQQPSQEPTLKDDHSLWEEAFEKLKQKQGETSNYSQEQSDKNSPLMPEEIDENREFEENRKERIERAKEVLRQKKESLLRVNEKPNNNEMISIGTIGASNNSIDWKKILKREIETSETVWTQRRSIAENNYAYRLEENDEENEAETEIMIDVSGSVDLSMVKAFLRMLKSALELTKLKVGCFNEKFWGITEIKSLNDIDNFTIPKEARGQSSWTEDWDLAVRSFTKSKDKKINKIVFTDGYPAPGTMPKEDLRHEKVLWLVYGNDDFKPCCGKVIHITEEELQISNSCQISSHERGRFR
ncbi:MAG: hypothetical protein J6B89_01145 [Bacilli bacterium]|nr:hypothetical protein [Bacilli bacterium]